MIPDNSGMYPRDTKSNTIGNTMSELMLRIPLAHINETISWLVGHAIPFELRFLQSPPPETPSPLTVPQTRNDPKEQAPDIGQKAKPANYKAIEAMYRKYIDNVNLPTPTISAVAREAGLGEQAFKNNFQLIYQKTFLQAHLEKRMQQAAKLLSEGYPCNKVALMVGYAEKSAIKFNKMFQKHYGMTPKRYQLQKTSKGHKAAPK